MVSYDFASLVCKKIHHLTYYSIRGTLLHQFIQGFIVAEMEFTSGAAYESLTNVYNVGTLLSGVFAPMWGSIIRVAGYPCTFFLNQAILIGFHTLDHSARPG